MLFYAILSQLNWTDGGCELLKLQKNKKKYQFFSHNQLKIHLNAINKPDVKNIQMQSLQMHLDHSHRETVRKNSV